MKIFRQFAFISTIATYIVIFAGGLVRVSGAGLGCPDWPKCFGRWFPPTNISQLPPNIDPSLFNITLAWIEYVNRLAGVILGFLILITAFLAIKYYRKEMRILIPSLLAAILVAFQGWQGGQVVESELASHIVSIHMGVAFLIVSLLIYVTQQAYYYEYPDEEKKSDYPNKSSFWIGLLWLLTIVQIVLGTEVRSGLELIEKEFPLLPETSWLGKVGLVSHIHTFLGIVIVIGTFQVGSRILRLSKGASDMVKQVIWGMMTLGLVQVLIGAVLVVIGLPDIMEIFHLWVASLYVGAILVLFSAFRQYGRAK
jgi:cytochrome c oxidase assembly protein subunit 15